MDFMEVASGEAFPGAIPGTVGMAVIPGTDIPGATWTHQPGRASGTVINTIATPFRKKLTYTEAPRGDYA